MKEIDFNLPCPACKGPLAPRVLGCPRCGIKVEGPFTLNEFAGLPAELLHFLRIFVHCEGRIKDMEKALGVSYPTVKATMAQLKEALNMPRGADPEAPKAERKTAETQSSHRAMDLLARIERGDVSVADALSQLRDKKPPKG